jgi:hypothetical protein
VADFACRPALDWSLLFFHRYVQVAVPEQRAPGFNRLA